MQHLASTAQKQQGNAKRAAAFLHAKQDTPKMHVQGPAEHVVFSVDDGAFQSLLAAASKIARKYLASVCITVQNSLNRLGFRRFRSRATN